MKTLILLLLFATPVYAQTKVERAADYISTGLVAVNIVTDAVNSYENHCMKQFIFKNLLTIAAAESVKLIVPEDRPDHSDNRSFYSLHSALAAANTGWRFKLSFSIALGTGTGRVVGKKHHLQDVGVGLLAGIGAEYLFPCSE